MGYLRRVEEVDPLLQRNLAPFVEVVDLQNIVFRIKVADSTDLELLLLERRQRKDFPIMNTAELSLAVVHDVCSTAKIEVDNFHTVDLTDVVIALSAVDILGDKLRRSEEHPLEICLLCLVLNLDDVQLAVFVLCKHVNTVLLVVLTILIALTLQKLLYLYLLVEQGCQESLQDSVVGFVAKQPLHRPVKSYIFWFFRHV